MSELVLKGVIGADGIAVGPLVHWRQMQALDRVPGSSTEERKIFNASIATARTEISTLMQGLDEVAFEIMEFQLAMLEDDDFLAPVLEEITQGLAADVAWEHLCAAEIQEYVESGSEYLAERVDDLRDIRDRVLRAMAGATTTEAQPFVQGGIIFTQDLTPSQFLAFDWDILGGLAIRGGSPTSHVSILARARGVVLLVGVVAPSLKEMNGVLCVLDAEKGQLILAPSEQTQKDIKATQTSVDARNTKANKMRKLNAITTDGQQIKMLINIDTPQNLEGVNVEDCDGIGLFRTEFLIEGSTIPDEDTQVKIYRSILTWARGRPVTIRTFDAGGDKPVPGVSRPSESNPFLGLRGVRLSLSMPEVFKTQLRAMVRANDDGNLKIMVPMVSVPAEMAAVKALLDEVCASLGDHNRPPLGMMVEVPAAALTAASFDADFFSIGSNDLVQYTMAAARDNPTVSHLANGDNPAVLALIAQTIAAANAKGIEVSLCGDMASDEKHTQNLLKCGLRVFSVSNALLGRVKMAISSATSQGRTP